MPTRAERLKNWEEKQAKAKAEIQRIKALDRAAEKKKDTKQRILLGSWTRKMMKEGTWPATRKEALESMDKFFTRASDRVC